MKKTKFLSIITILLTGVIFYACSNDNDDLNNSNSQKELLLDTKIPTDMEGIRFGSITLPKGTKSKISENGSRLDFKLPKNYIYVATDVNGKAFFADSGSYTCTSTCSDGCDVVKLGDVVGCSACPEGSTAPCTGKRGKKTIEGKKSSYSHQIGEGKNGGLINLGNGISFINFSSKRKKLGENLPNFDVMIKLPKFKSEFDIFFDKIWNGALPNTKNSKEVLVDFYGQTISILIPIKTYNNSRAEFVDGDKISCSCSSGSSGCTLKKIKKGLITVGHSCVAGSCTSCTMSW